MSVFSWSIIKTLILERSVLNILLNWTWHLYLLGIPGSIRGHCWNLSPQQKQPKALLILNIYVFVCSLNLSPSPRWIDWWVAISLRVSQSNYRDLHYYDLRSFYFSIQFGTSTGRFLDLRIAFFLSINYIWRAEDVTITRF